MGKKSKSGSDQGKAPKRASFLRRALNWLLVLAIVFFAITSLSFKSYSGIWPWDDVPRYWAHLKVTFEGVKIRSEGGEKLKADAKDLKKYAELLSQGAERFEDGQTEFDEQDFEDAAEEFEAALKLFTEAQEVIPEDNVAEGFVLKTRFMIRQCQDKQAEEEDE